MVDNKKLAEILGEALGSYKKRVLGQTASEWLKDYLKEKMPSKSEEEIGTFVGEIMGTLELLDEKKVLMEAALAEGQSAENWMTHEIAKLPESNGEKAKTAAEFLNSINEAQSSRGETETTYRIDIAAENWDSKNWNDYKLKDTVKGVVIEAGNAGVREVASEDFRNAAQEGCDSDFNTDSPLDSQEKEEGRGAKAAVSAGLFVASVIGFISPAKAKTIATVAHKAIECYFPIRDAVRGEITTTQAMAKVKNITISTFCGLWDTEGTKDDAIYDAEIVFDRVGAAVTGIINGLLTPKKDKPRLVTVLQDVKRNAFNFVTKKVRLPFKLNKNKNLITNNNT